jgi:transcriptional regulator with XRE-family HTH domain
MDATDVDMELLSELLRSRRDRDNLSLRDAAEEIGVSAPTLQRVESGQIPTAPNLLRILDWLHVQVADLRSKKSRSTSGRGTIAQIEVHLRADPALDARAAGAIVDAVL